MKQSGRLRIVLIIRMMPSTPAKVVARGQQQKTEAQIMECIVKNVIVSFIMDVHSWLNVFRNGLMRSIVTSARYAKPLCGQGRVAIQVNIIRQ